MQTRGGDTGRHLSEYDRSLQRQRQRRQPRRQLQRLDQRDEFGDGDLRRMLRFTLRRAFWWVRRGADVRDAQRNRLLRLAVDSSLPVLLRRSLPPTSTDTLAPDRAGAQSSAQGLRGADSEAPSWVSASGVAAFDKKRRLMHSVGPFQERDSARCSQTARIPVSEGRARWCATESSHPALASGFAGIAGRGRHDLRSRRTGRHSPARGT